MGPTRPYKRKPRGLPGALHLGWLCVVAFSAENRESTFPENAPVRGRIFCGKPGVHFSGKCSCAWSHFLRKTGSPLFRKMLPLRGRIFCGKPGGHFSGKCFQRSEVAAVEVAVQIEAHVRIGIGTEIVVVVVNRGALRRRTRLSFRATDRLVELRGMLGGLDAARTCLCEGRRSDHGGERRHGK